MLPQYRELIFFGHCQTRRYDIFLKQFAGPVLIKAKPPISIRAMIQPRLFVIALLSLFLADLGLDHSACAQAVEAFPKQEERITQLERKIGNLERKAGQLGVVASIFAAFCALWAQNTGRSAWLWFFLGLFFSVITVIVLLWKNSKDRAERGPGR